jgi:epsin
VAAKELTALILDEERLDAERRDRKSWKSRVTGIEEFAPEHAAGPSSRRHPRRQYSDEDDTEYKLAIEASKQQEEEDRRKRESRQTGGGVGEDDDLAKAIKLSREEEERRRRELEESNASSLFDDDPVPSSQPQFTGMNMGYQQGNNVDWLGNPIDQSQQLQPQQTSFMNNTYTGYNNNNNGFSNGFAPQQTGFNNNPYGQQLGQPQAFQMQPTGYNPYAQQQSFQPQPTATPEQVAQPGSNNPWARNNNQMQTPIQATKTGSNNPFASGFNRPQTSHTPPVPSLNSLQSLPEQKSLQTFTPPPPQSQSAFAPPQQPQQQLQQQPQKPMNEHQQRLNALLASGEGMDTYGNTGDLRIPAQHTAPGTFVNSAGANANQLTANATGNNPFLRQQFTGMPQVSYNSPQVPAATGPANMNGFGGASNPFAARPQQQSNQGQDLIQF